jgi:hypothetical protein
MPDLEVRSKFTKLAERQAAKTKFERTAKVIFFIGRGRTGKTTNIRYLIRQFEQSNTAFAVFDIDATNPVLHQYVDYAQLPPSYGPDSLVQWLTDSIISTVSQQAYILIDLGGGDTTLAHLISSMPRFVQVVQGLGSAVLAFCTLGPSPDDLMPLSNLHRVGFQPSATVLLLNEASLGTASLHTDAFIDVVEHSFYRRLIDDQNAVPLLIPRLQVADEVERRRLGFTFASNGEAGVGGMPLTFTQRVILNAWLEKMTEAYRPIAEWLA